MADSSLQTLLSTKAALDLGLISQADFDAVKNSFLRAQQIKAALDVGLIRQADYESAKLEYLGSLAGASTALAPTAPARPPPPAEQQRARPNGSSTAAPAHRQQAQPSAPPARPPVAPLPPAAAAPPPQQQPPAPAAPAPAAAAVPVHRTPSSGSLPTNIPKMGGIKHSASGVRHSLPFLSCAPQTSTVGQ